MMQLEIVLAALVIASLLAAILIVWRVAKAGGSVTIWGGITVKWGDKKCVSKQL